MGCHLLSFEAIYFHRAKVMQATPKGGAKIVLDDCRQIGGKLEQVDVAMSSPDLEKKPLLRDDEKVDSSSSSDDTYGARQPAEATVGESWLERNKDKIPGYGMLTLLRQVKKKIRYHPNEQTVIHSSFPSHCYKGFIIIIVLLQASAYMIYVLLIMLAVYLMNQLNRFTISITAKYVGADLDFGTRACIPNVSFIKDALHEEGLKYSRYDLITHYYSKCEKSV